MTHPDDDFARTFGRDPDPLTVSEWAIVLTGLTLALGIIGGLFYLCLTIIRG